MPEPTNRSRGNPEVTSEIEALRQELSILGDKIGGLPQGGAPVAGGTNVEAHLRRFMPFYALATIWVLMLVLFPTANRSGTRDELSGVGVQGGAAGESAGLDAGDYELADEAAETAGTSVGTTVGSTAGGGRSGQPGRATSGAASRVAPAVSAGVQVGVGVTRGGFECKPGVRQLPWSSYAAPCVAKFEGANGGATSRGVHPDKIILATREFPDSANSQAVQAFAQAAGAASAEVEAEVRKVFLDYFHQAFETYGRTLEWVKYPASSQSNSTEEAQSRGKEGACIDATKVAQEVKAFMVTGSSGPYSECLAERKVVSIGAGAYFPETWYRKFHPYLFNGVMDCERISYQVAEYMGKRLVGRQAKWSGDPVFQKTSRKFGTYVPNNDEYQHCVKISEDVLEQKYGHKITSRYNYTLDVSRFPDEAARGVVQFKAAGVTTIVNACDPYSTLFLTQAAAGQNYFPEWYIIGVALQDVDSVARLFDQSEVDGHLYGMSQLGDTSKLVGPTSEPGITYKRITGKEIPANATGGYWGLVPLFSMIQAAGPNLTPQTLEKAIHSLPAAGMPGFAVGYVSYQDAPDGTLGGQDHTGIDDGREIYWCGTCKSKQDGKQGAYIETYGGKRFRNNEWPAEEPPVYPPNFRETFKDGQK